MNILGLGILTFSFISFVSAMSTAAKTILITGATDGIGRLAAKKLVDLGHTVIIHGRNPEKIQATLTDLKCAGAVEGDLSNLAQVKSMAEKIKTKYDKIDVLINNAGVLKAGRTVTENGWDIRFVVNTLAPFLLTKLLIAMIPELTGRVINISSAGQAPVDLDALRGTKHINHDFTVYCQSKLAIMAWTRHWAHQIDSSNGPVMISVNPGSLLATKMVKEGFGMAGNDVNTGADTLVSLALDPEHQNHNGDYYDNDRGGYGTPHPDVLNDEKSRAIFQIMEEMLAGV